MKRSQFIWFCAQAAFLLRWVTDIFNWGNKSEAWLADTTAMAAYLMAAAVYAKMQEKEEK